MNRFPYGATGNAESDNADLWGLNPQTGQLYTTRDRRAMLADRGVKGNLGGPQPSMMWDDYTDRVYGAMHGLPENFRAPVAGGQLAPSAQALNRTLMKRARTADVEFEPGPVVGGMPNSPDTSFTGAGADLHMRPSMKPMQGYGGYAQPNKAQAKKQNKESRAANFYPNAGK